MIFLSLLDLSLKHSFLIVSTVVVDHWVNKEPDILQSLFFIYKYQLSFQKEKKKKNETIIVKEHI